MKHFTIIGVIAVLLASLVSAQFVEDFSVSSESVLQTYQGTPADSHYAITNTGNVASGYSVSVIASEAASWLKLGPLTFNLQPGQTQIVLSHLDVPRGQPIAAYPLQVVFTTTLGNQVVLDQDVKVSVPYNVLLESTEQPAISPCGAATFPVTVSNTGVFADTYSFFVTPNVADFTTFSFDDVVIGPGEKKTATMVVQPDDCSLTGYVDFTVSAVADSTQARADLDLTVGITNPFVPSFVVEDTRVDHSEKTFDVMVTNTGDQTATYALKLTGADFVTVSPASITLAPEESTTVTITSSPAEDEASQAYPLELTAMTKGIVFPATFNLTLKDYLWIELHPLWTAAIVLGIIILIIVAIWALLRWTAYTKTPEYAQKKAERDKLKAELAKQREAERKQRESEKAKEAARKAKENAKAKEEAAKQKEADRKAKEAAKLEAKLAKERASAKKEAERELKATNVLVSKETLKQDTVVRGSKWPWIIALLILIIGAAVLGYGYRSYLRENTMAAVAGAIALLVVIILIVLARWMRGTSTVTQTWSALKPRREHEIETGWRKGLGQVWIRVKEVIPNVTVSVTASRSNPAFAAPEGLVYQYFSMNSAELRDDQVERQRFLFRLPRGWMESHGVSEGNVKLMKATADGWKGVGTEKIRSDKKWVYYRAETVGLDGYAIVCKSKQATTETTGIAPGWWFVLLGIVLLAAIFGGAWYFAQAGSEQTTVLGVSPTATGIPNQAWDEDTRLTLDLSQYFTDPDGDTLDYTYTPIENIIVTISGDMATLTPEKDWSGVRSVTFTADDGKGGKVASNKVTLTVADVPEPTFWNNIVAGLERYALYIVIGIVLLVLLVILLEKRMTTA